VPVDWPGGVRHEGDASPVCGFCMEQEKAGTDTSRSGLEWEIGSSPCAGMGVSTVAGPVGGLARSSGEAPVMGVERRSQVICDVFVRSTETRWVREELREQVEVTR
jgi:hypothetical protein